MSIQNEVQKLIDDLSAVNAETESEARALVTSAIVNKVEKFKGLKMIGTSAVADANGNYAFVYAFDDHGTVESGTFLCRILPSANGKFRFKKLDAWEGEELPKVAVPEAQARPGDVVIRKVPEAELADVLKQLPIKDPSAVVEVYERVEPVATTVEVAKSSVEDLQADLAEMRAARAKDPALRPAPVATTVAPVEEKLPEAPAPARSNRKNRREQVKAAPAKEPKVKPLQETVTVEALRAELEKGGPSPVAEDYSLEKTFATVQASLDAEPVAEEAAAPAESEETKD